MVVVIFLHDKLIVLCSAICHPFLWLSTTVNNVLCWSPSSWNLTKLKFWSQWNTRNVECPNKVKFLLGAGSSSTIAVGVEWLLMTCSVYFPDVSVNLYFLDMVACRSFTSNSFLWPFLVLTETFGQSHHGLLKNIARWLVSWRGGNKCLL